MISFQSEGFFDLVFQREEGKFDAILGVGNTAIAFQTESMFSPSERAELAKYEGRRHQEFITARYFSKRSAQLISGKPYADILIERGVFGQPVLTIKNDAAFDVSISHKDAVSAALVFPRTHPCAIDIEDLDRKVSPEVWGKILSTSELTQYTALDDRMTIFSAKEALSKTLRCGMTTPFELFEVSEFHKDAHGCRGMFKNFTQYRFLTFTDGQYVLSIVYPRKSVLSISARP